MCMHRNAHEPGSKNLLHAHTYVHAALLTCKNARPSTFCCSRHAAEFHISLQRRAPEQMRYALSGTS